MCIIIHLRTLCNANISEKNQTLNLKEKFIKKINKKYYKYTVYIQCKCQSIAECCTVESQNCCTVESVLHG